MADPNWTRPLQGKYSAERPGRWNLSDSFPVVYLVGTVELARSFVMGKHRGLPYSVLDMVENRRPILVETDVPTDRFVDVVTDRGCQSVGLPMSYPWDSRGRKISWGRCQPIGRAAWEQDEPGIACRSASARRNDPGEELAWFERDEEPRTWTRRRFEDWFR